MVSARHAAPLHEPEGGWYAVLPLPAGLTDEDAALHLLQESSVLVHPGYFFDFQEDCLVVSLLPESGRFARAARSLGAYLVLN
jgi:aspartate/methionine/tyrosine aminotransferase